MCVSLVNAGKSIQVKVHLAKSPATSGLYFASLMRSPEISIFWGLFSCLTMSGLWAGVSVILVAALSIISSYDNVEKQEGRLAKTMFFMYIFFNLKEMPSLEAFLGRLCLIWASHMPGLSCGGIGEANVRVGGGFSYGRGFCCQRKCGRITPFCPAPAQELWGLFPVRCPNPLLW